MKHFKFLNFQLRLFRHILKTAKIIKAERPSLFYKCVKRLIFYLHSVTVFPLVLRVRYNANMNSNMSH